MSVEEIGKEICAVIKERKDDPSFSLKKHQLPSNTLYGWSFEGKSTKPTPVKTRSRAWKFIIEGREEMISIDEVNKDIYSGIKERKENLTRVLRKHQINPRTFYGWFSGKKSPSGPNIEKLHRLLAEYGTKKEAA